jgi:hypothetical protein
MSRNAKTLYPSEVRVAPPPTNGPVALVNQLKPNSITQISKPASDTDYGF